MSNRSRVSYLRRTKILVIKALCLFICLLSEIVCARDFLEMDLEELMQVTITGSTLTQESRMSVPSVVTVFTQDQIAALGIDYLYELLNFVPGYQFDRNGDSPSGYTFSARGRRNSAEAREVLLLVDGRRFDDPRTGGADGSLPLFPLAQIERVEIIAGPGSALYGSGAFNGVINVISRHGVTALSADAGGDGRRSVDGLFSTGNNNWQLDVFAHAYEDSGQNYSVSGIGESDDPRHAFALNVDLQIGDTRLQAAYHRLLSNNAYVFETFYNDLNSYTQEFSQLGVERKMILSDAFQVRLNFSYVNIEQNFSGFLLPEGTLASVSQPASSDPFLLKGVLAGKSYRLAASSEWLVNQQSNLQFGAEWQRNQETISKAYNNYDLGQIAAGQYPVAYYGDFSHSTQVGMLDTLDAQGLYGQWLYDATAKDKFTLGLRYDRFSEIGGHLSPRLAWVHSVNQQHRLKLLYGEAFRAPSLSEMGLINNPVLVGNPDLEHEIVKTVDFVWVMSLKDSTITLDVFDQHYETPIATGFKNNIRTYVNGENEYSQGISLEWEQELAQGLLLRTTATYFSHLPDSAFREADALASSMINYQFSNWNFNVSATYQSERGYLQAGDEVAFLDNFVLINSAVKYQLSDSTSIKLAVKNAMDKEYFTPSQGVGVGGIVNRGREWRLGMDMFF